MPWPTAEKKDKPAPAQPVGPRRSWMAEEAERHRRIEAGASRLQDVILGAWRPELYSASRDSSLRHTGHKYSIEEPSEK